jgi:hypothetical protein
MFSEKDHAGGMTFAARAAWVLVAFVFFMMFMPALMMSTAPQTEREPVKRTYTVPLTCYKSVDSRSRPILICDPPPINPASPPH